MDFYPQGTAYNCGETRRENPNHGRLKPSLSFLKSLLGIFFVVSSFEYEPTGDHLSMACKPLALTWALSTISGYGIYGLQIVEQYLRRGGPQIIATHQPGHIVLPALTLKRLEPVVGLARKLAQVLDQNQGETLAFDHPVLYAVGNECAGFAGQDRIRGNMNVGCAAIEHKSFGPHALEYAKSYDMFIAISRWNEKFLKDINVGPVHLCFQGIDTNLFMPGPSTGLWKDRFIIFSGGKFEFRKAQDVVAVAFKRFHERHPDALLLTCWQTLLPQDPTPFQMAGTCQSVPRIEENKGILTTPWLLELGLPQGSFLELPYTPNMLMPAILHECNAAIFPNRCEGGTNLVAMETMACGIPTVVADNTGQHDLVEMLDFPSFGTCAPVKAPPSHATVEDWGETDPDAVVEALEKIYSDYASAKAHALKCAEKIKAWDWAQQNEKLLHIVCD